MKTLFVVHEDSLNRIVKVLLQLTIVMFVAKPIHLVFN